MDYPCYGARDTTDSKKVPLAVFSLSFDTLWAISCRSGVVPITVAADRSRRSATMVHKERLIVRYVALSSRS